MHGGRVNLGIVDSRQQEYSCLWGPRPQIRYQGEGVRPMPINGQVEVEEKDIGRLASCGGQYLEVRRYLGDYM
jgi:hypothetical protein